MCSKCNRTFKQKSRYERHIANHPSEKHYLCGTCGKTFARMSHLEKHIRTHTEERRHICEVCGAAFILPHHLVRHMLIHSGDRPFQCEICNKTFTRKAGLTQHQYVHNGIRPYLCDVEGCGKQFTDRTTLRRHSLTHSREKPFICKECDKTFRTKSACRKHYLRHFKDDVSYKCGVCEEMFKDEEAWRLHSASHEEKRRTGAFRCGFCLRVFKSQEDLDSHVPLHETGLQHACSQCGIKFYTEDDLLKHMPKHFPDPELPVDTNSQTQQSTTTTTSPLSVQNNKNEQVTTDDALQHQHQQQEVVNDGNKVLVVLQLPQSANRNLKNEHGSLQVENIQQLLGTVRIDKLVVTTDPISNSSHTLALQLSQDQQQSMQQILQTTNIVDHQNHSLSTMSDMATSTFPNLQSVHPEMSSPNMTNHHIQSSPDMTNPMHQSSFVLKSLPHQSPPEQNKNISQYLIVPPTGPGFTPIDVNNSSSGKSSFPVVSTTTSPPKMKMLNKQGIVSSMDSNSVFKPSTTSNLLGHPLQLIVQDTTVQEENVHHFERNNKNNQSNCDTPSFTGNETTLPIHDLSGGGNQESGVTNTETKLRTSSASSYFQHSTEYENTLESDLLSQEHASEFSIVSN